MITTTVHKVNERVTLLHERPFERLQMRIRRITDGYYFHPTQLSFVPADQAGTVSWYEFEEFFDIPGLKTLNIITLPSVAQDLLFEYRAFAEDEEEEDAPAYEYFYERHIFGGLNTVSQPQLCTVYGTLIDVSGKPLAGQKVEAFLNRSGFFTHKAGLIGYASTTLTDGTGYFELPLVVGLDVTINVPIIGFTTRGVVPNAVSVELSSQCLLSFYPSL